MFNSSFLDSNSFSGVVANIDSHIAAAGMETISATSSNVLESVKTRIEKLTEIRNEIVEQERKQAAEYQKRVDTLLKEYGVSSEATSTNTPVGQKRKAPIGGNIDIKRPNFGFPPIPNVEPFNFALPNIPNILPNVLPFYNPNVETAIMLEKFKPMLGMFGMNTNHCGYQPSSPIGSVPFATLPDLLQSLIMEKFTYRDFKTFDQCCKHSNKLSMETRHKFSISFPEVTFENDIWTFRPLKGRPSSATTENLKNVLVKAQSLTIANNLTDALCHFMISQLETTRFSCRGDLNCQPELFKQLIEKYRLTSLRIHTRGELPAVPDVRKIDNVAISRARLSIDDVRNLKPNRLLSLSGPYDAIDMIKEKIEDMAHGDAYETHFLSFNIALAAMTEAMESFGHRAKLIDDTLNCWSVTDGKSDQPCVFVICGDDSVYLLNSSFHSGVYSRYVKYSN